MTPGLLPLSLYRVTGRRKVPVTPTNETRYRRFREALPVQIGNAVMWNFHGSQSGPSPGSPEPAGCLLSAQYAGEQPAPDFDYFATHTYAELAGGF